MDYKLLHGTGSGAASSPSTAEREAPPDPGGLRSALPDGAFETVDEVEGRLAAVAERAPAPLVRPSLEALTSGGQRLRPLLLVLAARMGAPGREDLLRVATAIEVLHTATLVHDDIVDGAETRRGVPTAVARYARGGAAAARGGRVAVASPPRGRAAGGGRPGAVAPERRRGGGELPLRRDVLQARRRG